jgi:hypothetical protein
LVVGVAVAVVAGAGAAGVFFAGFFAVLFLAMRSSPSCRDFRVAGEV